MRNLIHQLLQRYTFQTYFILQYQQLGKNVQDVYWYYDLVH